MKKWGIGDGDDWIQLARFLPEVGEGASHAKRFVEPATGSRRYYWTRSDGRLPRHMIDWRHMRLGKKGGGQKGSGAVVHVREAFLKHVFVSRYAK